ncbi:hypothetical protein Poly59_57600 [Rubripirellula reticaptiva]|uniref:Uncharacterized protein n=2 Tax=Rubripirellula reticaptiva TaxID=2528013 RepID=A0A5C6EFH4_9BACT|nr:hypothetical protein Poly59_57600 [Rubripirellula reticaptiva]
MWFESSQGVQLDGDSRVVSWQNLAEALPSAGSRGSATWQANAEYRPLWESNSFGNADAKTGLPTIKFHGKSE